MAKTKRNKRTTAKRSKSRVNTEKVAKTAAGMLIAGAAIGAAAYALKDKKTRKKFEKELKNIEKLGKGELDKFRMKLEAAANKSQKKLDAKIEKEMKKK